MSERNLKRLLLGLVGAMAVFVFGLIGIFFGENALPWAIWSTCVGGVGVLFFWSVLVVGSLMARSSAKRPAARPRPGRRRARVDTPQEVDQARDSVESDAALFFLAEPDPEAGLDTDRHADTRSPRPAAFRALGRRSAGASTGLPLEGLGPDDEAAFSLLMAQADESSVIPLASEGNGSHGDWLRRVKGTNCKGRLCWICGREHGPEIVHNSSVPLNDRHITVDVAQLLGWLDGADYGGRGPPPG